MQVFDILDGVQCVPGGQIRTGQDGTYQNSVPLVCKLTQILYFVYKFYILCTKFCLFVVCYCYCHCHYLFGRIYVICICDV
jgi:hypothetical protein